jgi:hypothetical protein
VAEIVHEISSAEYAIDGNLSQFVWMPQFRIQTLPADVIALQLDDVQFTNLDLSGRKPEDFAIRLDGNNPFENNKFSPANTLWHVADDLTDEERTFTNILRFVSNQAGGSENFRSQSLRFSTVSPTPTPEPTTLLSLGTGL